MGQKVNPHGLRVGVNKEWSSSWIANKKNFSDYLVEDNKIRTFINKKYATSSVSKVVIERTANRVIIDIFTSKPGVMIGAKGAGVEELKKELAKICGDKQVFLNIKEVKRPDLNAMIVAQSIAPARVMLCVMFAVGFPMITGNFYTSIGMAPKAIFLSLTRQVLFLIPLILCLPLLFDHIGWTPIWGVWWALPISDSLSVMTAAIVINRDMRKFKIQ